MKLGWYVHHHGSGHATRARCVLGHLDDVTVLTSLVETWPVDVVPLPMDVPAGGSDGPRSTPQGRLHHVPVGVSDVTSRAATVVRWLEDVRPDAVVVDASVEVTLLTRLSGVAPVVVRMHGDRTDPAHLTGLDAAVSLLAPYPEFLEDPDTPAWVRDRTTYVGGFSRHDGRPDDQEVVEVPWRADGQHVVVMSGTGGDGFDSDELVAAARATPDWTWHLLGDGAPVAHPPANLDPTGWIDDVFPYLFHADVVVASAGHNTVMEVASARRPMVCVPEERPHSEQHRKAQVLDDARLAVVRHDWPAAREWSHLLDEARSLDTSRWCRVVDGDGARRAAAHVRDVAEASG